LAFLILIGARRRLAIASPLFLAGTLRQLALVVEVVLPRPSGSLDAERPPSLSL
jgi:hypothetical protein